jgi:hypothetical protein
LADINPSDLAMTCPVSTLSPLLTRGIAGAPECCETGIETLSGTGSCSIRTPAVNLLSGGWIPPPGNVFNTIFKLK